MNCVKRIGMVGGLCLSAASGAAQTLYTPSGSVGSSSNANVGIGISNPGAKLDVRQAGAGDGGLIAAFGSSVSQRILFFDELNSTQGPKIYSAAGWPFVLAAGGNILFQPTGNVGIGTTNPGAKLEVLGQVKIGDGARAELQGPDRNHMIVLRGRHDGTAADEISYYEYGSHVFYTGGAVGSQLERFRITAGGNVGVGTANPGARFEVAGGTLGGNAGNELELTRFWQFDNNYDSVRVYSRRTQGGSGWGSAELYIQRRVDASDMGFVKFTDWDLALGSGGTEAIRIKNGGNVGIGTTSPSHKLTVNGTIRAKEVIVETGWADYVFADDYRLAPLSEVEAHIKEHKHLPGIPSASEVAEQGVSMGEMQARMMAKIEELTLHLIEQQKQIESLRAEVARNSHNN